MPIIPITDRTPEERKAIASKGGKAKAEKAAKLRKLQSCSYNDISFLRSELASLARGFSTLTHLMSEAEPYNDKLSHIASRAEDLTRQIEKHEQSDVNRVIYQEQ